MATTKRRQYSGTEKVAIIREHLLEGEPVSNVCDRHGIGPSLFYRWQKELFENGSAAFERPGANASKKEERRAAALEAKLQKKDSVIAEIMSELIMQKKRNGEI